jgi:hypothetical protein
MKKTVTQYMKSLRYGNCLSRLTKTTLCLLVWSIWITNDLKAQNMGYSFASSSGTYTPITGGTVHSSGAAMDDGTFSITLPFTFTFNGTAYTQVYVSENGYLSFGATNPGTTTRLALSSTNTGFEVATSFSADMQGINTSSELRSQVIGTAPNRTFVAQWSNLRFYLASGQSFNFQIQLDEANGVLINQVVRNVYGTVSNTGASSTAMVGLRGLNNTIYQNRTTTTAWASTTAGSSNAAACTISSTVAPASGLTFTWTPSPMTYTSSTTVQSSTAPVPASGINQQIIQVQVVAGGGTANPLTLTQLNLNTNGSTSTANIANAKVYYTGTVNTFSTTTQFGSTITSPSGTYSVIGSQALALGINYFWVTYDIVASPTLGNVLDGECTQITVSSSNYVPTVTAPAGSRSITSPLSGSYTVGAGGNFTTLTAAVTSLNASGVSGPVTFNLTDNSYSTSETFPIIINQFSGSSPVNTLTIKPASSTVYPIITGSASALLTLNGADNIIIDGSAYGNNSREMTFVNNNTGTSAVIFVSSLGIGLGSRNVTIQNCNIQGGSSTVTGVLGIFAGGTTVSTTGTGADNDKLSIINNSVSKAYYGIYCRGVASTGMNDTLIISNNSIGSNTASAVVLYSGIDVQNATLATINNNTIFNMTQPSGISTSSVAINLGGTLVTANVHSNVINGVRNPSSGGWGAYGINVQGTITTMNIYNNAISDISTMNYSSSSTTFNAFGIRISVAGTYRIYNNSIHLFGSVPNVGTTAHLSSCILFIAGTSVDMRNNIFVNSQTGLAGAKSFAIYSTVAATVFATTSNYNNYFVSGANGVLGYISSANQTTLTAWKTIMGAQRDSVSLNVNPAFNSNTIIRPTAASPILNTGTPLAMTATDLLGVTRNVTTPAMGAYEQGGEYIPPTITFTPLANVVSTANRTTVSFATITDTSGINITSGTSPRLYYKKSTNANALVGNTSSDNGWKWVEANNTSSPYDFTINYAILTGGSVVPGDQIQYFVVAQDLAATPNVTILNNNFIRTVATSVALTAVNFPVYGFNSYNILQQLSGNINVGASQTYTSLTNTGGLFEAINNSAIAGNVNVFVKTDLAETGTVALNQTTEIGAGNYTITIQPDSSQTRTISGTFAGGLVRLNGADRIAFDGRYLGSGNFLTFQNLQSSGTTACIQLISLGNAAGAVSNTIRNCNFVMPRTGVTAIAVAVGGSTVNTAGSDNDTLSLLNNYIRSASTGFQLTGNTGFNHDVTTITNNNFDTLSVSGITAQAVRTFTINSNTINNIIGGSSVVTVGISLVSATSGTLSLNAISNILSSGASAQGIFLGTGDSVITVSRNNITRISHIGTSGFGGKGIDVNTGLSNSNIELSNNFINNISGDGFSTIATAAIVGIRIGGNTGGVRVYYNTVNMYGSISRAAATADVSSAFAITSATTSNLDVRNNIFRNSIINTTGVQTSYAIYHAGTNLAQFSTLSRNNYIASGTQAQMGFINAANCTNMAAWRAAAVADSLSQSRSVNFVDSTSNLRLTGVSLGDLFLRAPRINTTDVDFDGNNRLAVTYAGAHQADTLLTMSVNAGADQATCSGSPVQIGSSSIVLAGGIPPYSYSWSPSATAVPNPLVSPTSTTNYIVTVTDSLYFTGIDTVVVTVTPVIAGNTATGAQTICSGSTPTGLTGSTPSGGTGTFAYTWLSSTSSATIGFTAAGGTNNTQNYTSGALTANTWFRRVVSSGVCNADTSAAVAITVNPVIAGNTVGSNQSILSGANPAALTGALPTGGSGTYTYIWLSSTTSSTAGFAAASGTNNTQNYTPGALTQNTWYRRLVSSGACSDTSTTVAITITSAIAGNTITANQTICSASSPAGLVGALPTGGTGTYTYTWLSSTTSATAGFAAASGTNNTQNYAPGALTQNTWYRRYVISGVATDTSAAVAITVNAAVAGNTATGAQTICSGSTPTGLTGSTPTGGTGTYTYTWLVSTTSATAGFVAASGTNNTQNYASGALTANTWFRRRVSSGVCGADTSVAILVSITNTNTWTGATSGAWEIATNWGCGRVPIISDSAVIVPATNQPIVIDGDRFINHLAINSGATLTINNANAQLGIVETFTKVGTLNHTDGYIGFLGTTAVQTIPANTYARVFIGNPFGVQLGGNITVTDTLNFNSGPLFLGNNNLTMSGSNSVFFRDSTTRHIITNGTGTVNIANIGSGGRTSAVRFPVGINATSFAPITITNTGTQDQFSVRVISGVNSNGLTGTAITSNAVNRTWAVNELVNGGSNATVTLQWNAVDELSGFTRANSYVAFYNGTTWMSTLASAATGSNPYTQTRTGITSFNAFGVGSGGTLPVELISFNGKLVSEKVQLNWATASEVNNDYFVIERSANNKMFEAIGDKIRGAGNSNVVNQYQLFDDEAMQFAAQNDIKTIYYRLRQVDFDGSVHYTQSISVLVEKGEMLFDAQISPNPFSNAMRLNISTSINAPSTIEITDVKGTLVRKETLQTITGNGIYTLTDLDKLAEGMYFVKVIQGTDAKVMKVTKTNN